MTALRNPLDFAQRLRALESAIDDLARYAVEVDRERLHRDRDVQNMVLHALFIASQASVDLALQVCADRGFATDGSYRDAFRALSDGGTLDPELGTAMQGWAGLRNVVAHFYPVIDLDRVHDACGEIEALRSFAAWAGERMVEE